MAVVERRPLAGRASVRHWVHQFVPLLETGSARAGFAGKSCTELLRQDLCGLSLCAIEARAGYVRLLKNTVLFPMLLHPRSSPVQQASLFNRNYLPPSR